MAELVVLIRQEHDEERRARLLDWYWAKASDHYGIDRWGDSRAVRYRLEYEWLVAERARRIREAEVVAAVA